MYRKNFLKSLGILSFGAVVFNYGVEFNSYEISAKEIISKILNNKNNWEDYSQFKLESKGKYLKGKGIEYIVNSSKKILSEDPTTSEGEINLDLTRKFLGKVFCPEPSFVIPFVGNILIDFNQAENKTSLLAKIKKEGKTRGLWYGNVSDSGEKSEGQISIPYYDRKKILVYGEGEKFGVKGNFLGLIQYKKNFENKLHVKTSCFINVEENVYSFISMGLLDQIAANKAVGDIEETLENCEILSKILDDGGAKHFEGKYSKEKIEWLVGLVGKK